MVKDDIDIIAPEPRVVCGFRIVPVTVGRLPAFIREVRPLSTDLAVLQSLPDDIDPDLVTEILLNLVENQGDQMLEAVSIAVAPSLKGVAEARRKIEELEPDEFLLLALAVVQVNADFFVQRLLPALTRAGQAARMLGAGPTP